MAHSVCGEFSLVLHRDHRRPDDATTLFAADNDFARREGETFGHEKMEVQSVAELVSVAVRLGVLSE